MTQTSRYLRDLQKQAFNWQRAHGAKRSRDSAFGLEDELSGGNVVNDIRAIAEFEGSRPEASPASPATQLTCNIWTSPFTLPTTVITDTVLEQRKWST